MKHGNMDPHNLGMVPEGSVSQTTDRCRQIKHGNMDYHGLGYALDRSFSQTTDRHCRRHCRPLSEQTIPASPIQVRSFYYVIDGTSVDMGFHSLGELYM